MKSVLFMSIIFSWILINCTEEDNSYYVWVEDNGCEGYRNGSSIGGVFVSSDSAESRLTDLRKIEMTWFIDDSAYYTEITISVTFSNPLGAIGTSNIVDINGLKTINTRPFDEYDPVTSPISQPEWTVAGNLNITYFEEFHPLSSDTIAEEAIGAFSLSFSNTMTGEIYTISDCGFVADLYQY